MSNRLHPLCRRLAALGVAVAVGFSILSVAPVSPPASAATSSDTIEGGAGSEHFGLDVTVLPNGNFVVVDYGYDAGPVEGVGAVHLYDGQTEQLISTLTGSSAADSIGSGGVVALPNSNFLVVSVSWDNGDVRDAGAVTFVNGTRGIDGPVTAENSLHGGAVEGYAGFGGVTVLTNGNYVVRSDLWSDGPLAFVGAVTFGDSTTGVTGPITTANSLIGPTSNDQVGSGGVTPLTNGNYAVTSPLWDGPGGADVGAATLGDGTTGVAGPVTPANSLHGTSAADRVGSHGATALPNGGYVVASPTWDSGVLDDVGAVTPAPAAGAVGAVTVANSLHGTSQNDNVGFSGVVALTNGNYVVASEAWDNPVGPVSNVGAVTFVDADAGPPGPVSAVNSLHGAQVSDTVGSGHLVALANGNYAVSSPTWANGGIKNAGAVTVGDGETGTTGPVGTANSLYGITEKDYVGDAALIALATGDVVVASPSWDRNGVVDVGAVTVLDGEPGIDGPVGATNSMYGTTAEDRVGSNGVATEGGGFAVVSPGWDLADRADVGAVTVVAADESAVGPVSPSNSVHGDAVGDRLGDQPIVALEGGGVVVRTPSYDDGQTADAGAATYLPETGLSGPLGGRNSVIGLPGETIRKPSARMTSREVVVMGTNGNRVLLLRTGPPAPQPPALPEPPQAPAGVVAVTPGRLLETRPGESTVDGRQEGIGRRTAREETVVEVAGRHGVPGSATAVMVNVAVIDPDERG
ncbi:MAG: hypothetical protein AAFY28_19555, partial [Actinomycetota bacterium]